VEDADFSDDFCRFLQATVPGVDAAELLLLLHAHPEQAFSTAEAVAALRVSVTLSEVDAARHFAALAAAGLVALDAEGRAKYRPASELLAARVQTLAQAYRERPVTLIRVIYALRDKKIQSFADAFKLRRS
jgi:hypothetical protein